MRKTDKSKEKKMQTKARPMNANMRFLGKSTVEVELLSFVPSLPSTLNPPPDSANIIIPTTMAASKLELRKLLFYGIKKCIHKI